MATPQLILDLDIAGYAADVRFNDVVLSKDRSGEPVRRAMRLGAWSSPGANPLTVDLGVLPARGEAAPPERRFKLLVRRTMGEAEEVLLQYEHPPAPPLPPGPAPVRVFTGNVPFSPPAPWRWLAADRLTSLSAADHGAIEALMRRLHAALVAKDFGPLLEAQSVQVSENAIAAGERPEGFLASYREFLNERMGDVTWRVEPLGALSVDTMAAGRVHHVTGPRGAPPLVARTSESVFAIDPFVSRLNGQWLVVR